MPQLLWGVNLVYIILNNNSYTPLLIQQMDELTCRELTSADWIAYKALRLYSLKEAPFAFSDAYEDLVTLDDSFFKKELTSTSPAKEEFTIGAFSSSQKMMGFIYFRRDQRSKARHKAMVHRMYVHPTYRRKGIGHQLITRVLKRAQQLDRLEQIHLWVLGTDSPAQLFYEKLGFESQGTVVRKDLIINGIYVDAVYMVLYL